MPIAPIVGTFPTTQFAAMPQIDIEWAPTSNPLNAPVYTSFAGRVHELSTTRGRSTELQQYQAGKCSVLLDNIDRYIDPTYTASPWYPGVLPERQLRITARWAGVTYDVYAGFLDGWPQNYQMNTTLVQLSATDGFKVLAATSLTPAFDVEIAKDQPTHWWQCGEAQLTGLLTTRDNGYGGTLYDGTLVSGIQLGGQPLRQGSTGSVVQNAATGGTNPLVQVSTSAYPPAGSTAFSFEFWAALQTATLSNTATFWSFGDFTTAGGRIKATTTGAVLAELYVTSTIPGSVTTTATPFTDTNPHHIVVTYSGTNTRWRVYIDGVLDSTDSTGIPANITISGSQYYFCSGVAQTRLSDAAVYHGVELTATQVLTHYNAGLTSFSGEDTGTRAGRILDQTAWPSARRTIDTGDVNVGPHDWSGMSALDYLQKLAQTEVAEFYIEANGNVVWRNRSALTDDTRSNTSQATFGDGNYVAGLPRFGDGLSNVSDSFNRADNASSMGSTDSADGGTSVAWAPQSGTWGISGNKAYEVSGASQSTTVVDSGLADCTISVTFDNIGFDHGMIYRSTDDNNYFLLSNSGTLYRKQAGSYNNIGSPPSYATGDIATVVVSGNTHTIYKNGVQVLQVTDSFQNTATKHGLRANLASGCRFDNFRVIRTVATELPYSDIVIDYGEVQIRNDITITRQGATPQRASDTTSIEKYLRHSYDESGGFDQTDATALTRAQAILAKYKDPKLRVTSIVVDPGNDPTNLFPQVLGRKIGDRITVVRRPQNVGTAISQDCWIEGIDHDVKPDEWITTFHLVAVS